jgi:catechol 2,3-dioxygenase-like lactoylglutathione lyase family enzyme
MLWLAGLEELAMTIRGVDHINIGTDRLTETVAFFKGALGLQEGWRPPFGVPGAWLYAGDAAVVHLVELNSGKRPCDEAALDHFAFAIDDWDGARQRLEASGVDYRATDVPGSTIKQIFLRDPNGVNIELNYRESTGGRASAVVAAIS